jgi:hypothetical protein
MLFQSGSQDEECVPRMLRSAISAFTRVFDTLCDALLIRGPSLYA